MKAAVEPRPIDNPQPGYFALRLVRGGPKVGAQIVHENGIFYAVIDGMQKLGSDDPHLADQVDRIWTWGEFISESEYRYLVERSAWAKKYDPNSPLANPTQPINLLAIPPLF